VDRRNLGQATWPAGTTWLHSVAGVDDDGYIREDTAASHLASFWNTYVARIFRDRWSERSGCRQPQLTGALNDIYGDEQLDHPTAPVRGVDLGRDDVVAGWSGSAIRSNRLGPGKSQRIWSIPAAHRELVAVNDYIEVQAVHGESVSINLDVSCNYSPEFMMAKVLG